MKVVCSLNSHAVGGTVTGLASAESVVLQNNGADNLHRNSSGAFAFSTEIVEGARYQVTILRQPSTQACTVYNGSGVMGDKNVNNIKVKCSTNTHILGGTVSGLAVTESVTLVNNGGNPLIRNANGSFAFTQEIPVNTSYNVTVQTYPSTQTCTVTNGQGIIGNANVTNIQVACSSTGYSVGGTVSGLPGSQTVELLLNGNSNDSITPTNGGFAFPTTLVDNTAYNVTVIPTSQPAGISCAVYNGSGSYHSAI